MSSASALPNLMFFPEDRQLVGISNWAVFCDHLKSVARATGLSGYLDGTIIAPSPTVTETAAQPGNPGVSTHVTTDTTTTATAAQTATAPAPTPINSRNPSIEE
ncbi:hypothetical protein C8R42DRAFT_718632 [Lentinula raphanica]|nr:hypothetical protein C8R42DRAFT_718632 [Lentinula raphanica]